MPIMSRLFPGGNLAHNKVLRCRIIWTGFRYCSRNQVLKQHFFISTCTYIKSLKTKKAYRVNYSVISKMHNTVLKLFCQNNLWILPGVYVHRTKSTEMKGCMTGLAGSAQDRDPHSEKRNDSV